MGADLSFFEPGNNPLLNLLELRAGLSAGQVAPLVFVLAVLLGHCAYTDMFCGRIIRNATTMAAALVCLAATPLLLDPDKLTGHFAAAGVTIVVLVLLYLVGAFKEGDLKIYAALALLLGPATAVFVLASFAVIVLYSVRAAVATQLRRMRDRRAGVTAQKAYRTYVPAGPGIALAMPLTMLMAGISPGYCLLVVGVQVATVALSLQLAYLSRKADELEAQQRAEAETAQPEAAARELSATPAVTQQPASSGAVAGTHIGGDIPEAADEPSRVSELAAPTPAGRAGADA